MAYAYDAAEISDLARESAAAERAEYYDALGDGPEDMCSDGQHYVRPTRNGGGACPCGFTVDRDEL